MRDIHLEVIYPDPVGVVWEALTDPKLLADWLMQNDFRAEVGHAFSFVTEPAPGFDGVVRCKVLEIEPERRLRYSWVGGGQDTQVTWELEPHGRGTRVTLTHSGFSGIRGVLVRNILAAGWKSKILRRLGEVAAALSVHSEIRR